MGPDALRIRHHRCNKIKTIVASDIVVIGAAKYNFGIQTQLKSWFDQTLVAGKPFRCGENGVEGPPGAKRVVVALARGGHFTNGPAAAIERTETHLRATLGFIGVTQHQFIIA
ncbi:NAD(P)H-dependent oxidoreductase [Sphingomonas sp. R647]|nr:NAD(P)H-dependent oxidoreductase [Sphingomonas sp. R647]